MNVFGSVVDVTSRGWNYVLEQQFEEKLDELRVLMGQLKAHRDGVMSRVEVAEAGLLKRIPEVDAWLKSFDDLEKDVSDVLQEGSMLLKKCCITAWCPWNCWTNQKFGKKVVSKISLVRELRDRGDFQDVAERRSSTQVQEVPEDPYTVGLDSASSAVWVFLEQDSVGIVGIHGLGGVGKTTLLKKINNLLLTRSPGFDFVIWVVVSKEVSMERVQKDIGHRLGLSWSENVDMSSRASDIFNMLRSKKFLLLLDDLWERLELTAIGVPLPSFANKSKIIFTTRSEVVCGAMEANEKVRVECLKWSQAWDLFQNKVGIICSDPEIQPLAETVAKECDGLPLALTVIGRTMASKKTAREWQDAITTLQKHAEKLSGMDKVFSVLKYSYDDLADDSIRSCFLFCSVYPEDYKINVSVLVEQWIGMGYIAGFDEWEEAINIGHRNIGILKALSLLEEAENYTGAPCVKMHDVIRDMAHWIEKDKILVITDAGFSEARRTEKLMKAQSITVWCPDGLKWLGDKPDCPKVTTFLLLGGCHQDIHDDFFLLMPALKFVHIRGTVNIPTSIFKLDLLEYLFFFLIGERSGIKILHEMKNLTSLKYLCLSDYTRNWRVPADVIIHLPNLKHIRLEIGFHHEDHMDDTETHIQDLQCSNELISADFTIEKAKDLEFVLNNQRLLDYRMDLYIKELQAETKTIKLALSPLPSSSLSCFTLAYMKRLRRLWIGECPEMEELLLSCLPDDTEIPLFQSLEEMTLWRLPKLVVTWDIRNIHSQCFRNLRQVSIYTCSSMTNVSWLLLAPNLQRLYIDNCEGIEEIMSNSSGACEEITFSNLKRLELQFLPNLRLVCANVLPLPSLEHICVQHCPGLRRLPLNPSNSPNNKVRSIQGSQKWWDNLQWESDPTKSAFVEFIRREA